ncbi:MAG: hypothetical protein KAY24_17940 [Candidatus Eisenbacteria sp.]|nr:hypothetical protein [Candidatus Eisenbacteria bacterium]
MQYVHPNLALERTWDGELDDARLHLVSALLATRAVLDGEPGHTKARILNALLNLDLQKPAEALMSFRQAFEAMTPQEREPFFSCDFIAHREQLAQLQESSERIAFWNSFWLSRSRSPDKALSYDLLEFWKRVALATLYYGPAQGWIDARSVVLGRSIRREWRRGSLGLSFTLTARYASLQ